MPREPDDWRLTGQERYLRGATLVRKRWVAPRPEWDHDHCAFCWAKFPHEVEEGYTTTEAHPSGAGYHWICEPCFGDFAERFGWRVVEPG